ncbi:MULTISPECIES: flagellar biosynthesis protein FlhA [Rhizobium/Agrobacterium group]|uniref:Flagellar biosynthesis protein FlhA n=2 Tax=Rhizobium/Agrobacterium group TaxID=227290 RepID=A0AA92C357_RHIRH|nr:MULTISPECIES: flagellar biosynthesis protein FlhA [Rhizobium/Agrobacterium group]KQM35588.1 flagellar biosynthesis protein FlhA [Rhizobium sp. Leaf202]KQN88323.1 flagellar biosynthesis protein FlhA [Rhizobium sp. Leaf68]KQR32189.1 flagellar biosynthesis protein FlhA [Rhizobium sp. Leaf155]KQZ97647.1 flagellar biosynthesis protein FlhA [Rhizobium sp. Root564]MDP9569965.1 flagellar biosynthesis protein FlhA [Agrobacterium larrymoorei]MQB22270.1 flagellar biosynthesis protein FlhA [Agrobacter
MATPPSVMPLPKVAPRGRDIGFAAGIVAILCILFLPIPPFIIDMGLAFSIAFSVLILMVSLWIHRPLDFSSFPTILLISTMIRLALNIATTRVILSHGHQGHDAAGGVIAGFSSLVMSGDFVIGLIVFLILIVVNFIVITKGATRIAEVGARFTLDAIPGKQMSIDADLSAGIINEKEAQLRRRELEEESSFYGAMDGASKFVRGDAVAGLLITMINICGGIIIGVFRHGMPVSEAADVFVKLSVGDGIVSQVPALIVSLAAGLIVTRGGTLGSTDTAVINQLSGYPKALSVAAGLMFILALVPGLPFIPFMFLSGLLALGAWFIPRQLQREQDVARAEEDQKAADATQAESETVKSVLRTTEIELALGKQVSPRLLGAHQELGFRVGKMRKKFAAQYGFVVPEIKVTDDIAIPDKSYQIRIHGTTVAANTLRVGEVLVITGKGRRPSVPGDDVREPAFGMPAVSVLEHFVEDLRREGFHPIDNISALLTHVSEVIRNNLPMLLSYKDVKVLIDRLDPEYKKLADEICSSHMSYSGLQAILKLLLAERVSIRNLHLILEAVAELAPHLRKTEQIVEHVRIRMAQQICGDLSDNGVLRVLRLGTKWDVIFQQALKRDPKGDVIEFDIDPRQVEEFSNEATQVIREYMDVGLPFVLVTLPETRAYVRMITERLFSTLPVLSHVELAKGTEIKILGSIS